MALSSPVQEKFWSANDLAESIQRQVSEYREEVGRRLRDLRKSRGFNQEDAAHEVGVAVKTWSLWERGVTSPYELQLLSERRRR